MPVIKLLSWHAEIAAKAASLKSKGITVDATPLARTSAVVGELCSSQNEIVLMACPVTINEA